MSDDRFHDFLRWAFGWIGPREMCLGLLVLWLLKSGLK